MPNNQSIFKDGVLVAVHVERWSGMKQLTPEDMGLKSEDVASAFHLGNKSLVPEGVIRQFRTIETRARVLVDTNSFPFPFGNARFIPRKHFNTVHDQLLRHQKEYNDLADELITNYPQYKADMEPIYREAAEIAYAKTSPASMTFSADTDPIAARETFITEFMNRIESYYPSVETLRRKFSMYWDIYEIAIPEMREATIQDIEQDEALRRDAINYYMSQTRGKIDGFVDTVVSQLREDTANICRHVAGMITKGKVIRSTTIESLSEFINKYKNMNFVGDQSVADQLDSLQKEVLSMNNSSTFADDESVKMELHKRLIDIATVASNMADIGEVTGGYKRRISWED